MASYPGPEETNPIFNPANFQVNLETAATLADLSKYVTLSTSQNLTGFKTFSGSLATTTIQTGSNVLTLPTATDTLAALNYPQTTQNKTFNISSSPAFASYVGTLATTNFAHTLEVGDIIKFPNTGALSAGIVANTSYTVATTPTTVTFTLTGVTITAGVVNSSTYYVVVQKINQNSANGGPLKFLCPSTGKAVFFDLSAAATDMVLRFQSAANTAPIQLPTNGGSIPNTANSTTISGAWTFSNQIISTRAGQTTGAAAGIYRNPASTALTAANNYHFSYFGTPATTGSTTGFAHTVHIQGQPSGASTASALYIEAGNLLMSPSGNIVTSNIRPTSGSVSALYPFNDLSTGTATFLISPSSVGWAAGGYGEVRLGDSNHFLRATNASGINVSTVNRLTLTGADTLSPDNGSTTYFNIGTAGITDPIGSNTYGLVFGSGASGSSLSVFSSVTHTVKLGRGNDGDIIRFFRQLPGTNVVGSISLTSVGTTYNVVSDRRLKENIVEAKDALDVVRQIKIYEFNFKSDEKKTRCTGVLADELREVVPTAVTGPADMNALDKEGNIDPLLVDFSKLVPYLVRSVQQLLARVEELERRQK